VHIQGRFSGGLGGLLEAGRDHSPQVGGFRDLAGPDCLKENK